MHEQDSQQFSDDQPSNSDPNPDGVGYSGIDSAISPAERGQSSFKSYDHLGPPSPSAKPSFAVYDHLEPPAESPYAALGGVDEADLTSFAYQIASGMVGHTETHY